MKTAWKAVRIMLTVVGGALLEADSPVEEIFSTGDIPPKPGFLK